MAINQDTLKTLHSSLNHARKGDQMAYSRFLTLTSNLLTPYFKKRLFCPNDLEDLVQETLVAIHKALHTYREEKPFSPWLFAIAKNKLTDYFRKHAKYAKIDSIENKDIPTEDSTSSTDIPYLLSGLTDKEKDIVTRLKIKGYRVKETAQIMNMSETALKTACHRAIKKIKKKVEKDEPC